MKELPNKDKLHSMYVREEMSISTISCLTGHAQKTIKGLMERYGIQKRKQGWVFRKIL